MASARGFSREVVAEIDAWGKQVGISKRSDAMRELVKLALGGKPDVDVASDN